jgi:hypothetical protein
MTFFLRHSFLKIIDTCLSCFFYAAIFVCSACPCACFTYTMGKPTSMHCKKRFAIFPSPAVTNQTLPGSELNYFPPGTVWLVTSRLGTGKPLNFLTVCTANMISFKLPLCQPFLLSVSESVTVPACTYKSSILSVSRSVYLYKLNGSVCICNVNSNVCTRTCVL